MVSVSRDQSIRFWDLPNRRLAHVIELPSPAGNAQFCRSANLLAVETAGSEVIVVECASRQIIRRFRGDARAAGTCLAFAEDGRWLLFGDSRGDLRIWNVPESREKGREKRVGRLVDWIRFAHVPRSVAVSVSGEFVATTHVGQRGIAVFANNAYYSELLDSREPDQPVCIDAPAVSNPPPETPLPSIDSPRGTNGSNGTAGTLRLARGPHDKWCALVRLRELRERNRPEETVKKPAEAPFFLPTTAGIEPKFAVTEESEKSEKGGNGGTGERFSTRREVLSGENELQTMLRMAAESEEPREARGIVESPVGETPIPESSSITSLTSLTTSSIMNLESSNHETPSPSSIHETPISETPDVEEEADVERAMGSFYGVLRHFRALPVSAADAELSLLCMGDFDEVGKTAVRNLLRFLERAMSVETDFEMVQALLERTLQLYGEVIEAMPEMKAMMETMEGIQERGWRRMQGLIQQTLCLVELFSNVQL